MAMRKENYCVALRCFCSFENDEDKPQCLGKLVVGVLSEIHHAPLSWGNTLQAPGRVLDSVHFCSIVV